MKSLKECLVTEKQTTGAGCVEMVKTIIDQLTKEHPDCKYNKEKNEWTGKDADLWKGAGQFLFDYLQELDQSDFTKIVDELNWKKWIPDMEDINPQDISMCMSLELLEFKK